MRSKENMLYEEELAGSQHSKPKKLSKPKANSESFEQFENFCDMSPRANNQVVKYATALGLFTLAGISAYAIFAKHTHYWPFKAPQSSTPHLAQPTLKSSTPDLAQPTPTVPQDESHNVPDSPVSQLSDHTCIAREQPNIFGGHGDAGGSASLPVLLRTEDAVTKWLKANEDVAVASASALPPVAPVESAKDTFIPAVAQVRQDEIRPEVGCSGEDTSKKDGKEDS